MANARRDPTGFQKGERPTPTTRDPNAVIVPRPFSAQIHSVSGSKSMATWTTGPAIRLHPERPVPAGYKLSSSSWAGQGFIGQIWTGWAPEGLYFAVKVWMTSIPDLRG